MKLNELLKLIDTVKDSDFSEFHFQSQEIQLTLRRGTEKVPAPVSTSTREEDLSPSLAPEEAQPGSQREEGLLEVTAPMVGTFYHAPAPGSEPFVKPGDVVAQGDTLCILEAMKLMNEIEADIGGEVVAVEVENGQLVEFGQLLITLRPLKP